MEFFKQEFEKQNAKMLEFIDAIENTFKEEREAVQGGGDPESILRNMVIDNIEYSLFSKIEKIREKYK